MGPEAVLACTSFEGNRRIAMGTVVEVAVRTKEIMDRRGSEPILIFDDATGQPVEIDFRGNTEDMLSRLPVSSVDEKSAETVDNVASRGPGRPKLGVVAREVTLLPRHWEWLNEQPGGASVALRKLVESARKSNETRDRVRRAQEAAYRFMSAIAGNFPDFEEANRALFAQDEPGFDLHVKDWPLGVQEYARKLAAPAFEAVN